MRILGLKLVFFIGKIILLKRDYIVKITRSSLKHYNGRISAYDLILRRSE